MQNMPQSNFDSEDIKLIKAEDLKKMTADPEDIYQKQKTRLIQDVMEALVVVAKQRGMTSYVAQFQDVISERMLSEVKTAFTDLGYKVEEGKNEQMRQIILTFDWGQ